MNTHLHTPSERRKLNSWKEIADYLQRDVRTVTRWEQEKGLPVHRAPGIGRQSVFAFADEIDAWMREPVPQAAYQAQPEPAARGTSAGKWALLIVAVLLASVSVAAIWWFGRPVQDSETAGPPAVPSTIQFVWPDRKIRFDVNRIDMGAISPAAIAVADLDHDGALDLATASAIGSSIAVLEGRGDGTFSPPRSYGSCAQIMRIASVDMDADGAIDLVVTCYESHEVRVMWGSPTRPFAEYSSLPAGSGTRGLAIGDLNRDGRPDIVASNSVSGSLSIFVNRGSRKFLDSTVPLAIGTISITLQDLNGDKELDLISSSTREDLMLMEGRGDGTFEPSRKLGPFRTSWLHITGDLDGDGSPEIVVPEVEGEVVVVSGKSSTIVQRTQLRVEGPFCMLLADFNGDGKPDILGSQSYRNNLTMLAGGADGRLVAATEQQPIGRYPFLGAAGDFNRDGLMDAVIPLAHDRALAVLIQKRTPN